MTDDGVFEVLRPGGASPFLFTCDHASASLPPRLGTLGLSEEDRGRHIAWDIGIAGVGRALAERLDAFVILQGTSRLAIDANRPPGSPESIVGCSDGTVIPGNQGLSSAERERRAREIFHPYHDRIGRALDRRAEVGQETALVALHSFTPIWQGWPRPWQVGVLHNRDARLAHQVLALLRDDPALVVGDNEPYAASEATDYTIVVHGERRGLPYVELELRQDLITEPPDQAAWADRLATVLERAYRSLFPC